MKAKPVICLMGPTASGKTELAIQLAAAFPVELVSVDSALVYRGMDIGTAKPDADVLDGYPHALVDIRDPEDAYSAGEFVRDAVSEIDAILGRGRIPLLVGGTMLYFRALTDGIADLPEGVDTVRAAINAEAAAKGWPALHAELAKIDPKVAARVNQNDSQRIQRALEVYRVSGKTLSDWQEDTVAPGDYAYVKIALIPEPRARLHERIAVRLGQMFEAGFIDEVRQLYERPALTAEHPSMRAVGYRQAWACLAGEYSLDIARERALAATRQRAQRKLTWLRNDSALFVVNPLEVDAFAAISSHLRHKLEGVNIDNGN
jgi:tRNA dimethylallyltransferase